MEQQEEVNKDVEVKYIEPAGDDELIVDDSVEKDTQSSSSEEEQPADEPAVENQPKEEIRGRSQSKRLPNETDREFALRLEVQRLKSQRREERKQEIVFDDQKPT